MRSLLEFKIARVLNRLVLIDALGQDFNRRAVEKDGSVVHEVAGLTIRSSQMLIKLGVCFLLLSDNDPSIERISLKQSGFESLKIVFQISNSDTNRSELLSCHHNSHSKIQFHF